MNPKRGFQALAAGGLSRAEVTTLSVWNHSCPTCPPGDSPCHSQAAWELMGWCHDKRDLFKCQKRKKCCSQIRCFVVGPKSDLTEERKQRRMCVGFGFFFFSLWSILGTPIRGKPCHCKGGFQVLAPKEAPGKTPLVCEQSENVCLWQLGEREMTFRFCGMFTSEENNLVPHGCSPCVWGGEVWI